MHMHKLSSRANDNLRKPTCHKLCRDDNLWRKRRLQSHWYHMLKICTHWSLNHVRSVLSHQGDEVKDIHKSCLLGFCYDAINGNHNTSTAYSGTEKRKLIYMNWRNTNVKPICFNNNITKLNLQLLLPLQRETKITYVHNNIILFSELFFQKVNTIMSFIS